MFGENSKKFKMLKRKVVEAKDGEAESVSIEDIVNFGPKAQKDSDKIDFIPNYKDFEGLFLEF
mgnify:CR=1 FL=1